MFDKTKVKCGARIVSFHGPDADGEYAGVVDLGFKTGDPLNGHGLVGVTWDSYGQPKMWSQEYKFALDRMSLIQGSIPVEIFVDDSGLFRVDIVSDTPNAHIVKNSDGSITVKGISE